MFGIYKLADLYGGNEYVQRELEQGKYVRAVPERADLTILECFRAAWSVFTQRAVALVPPKDGELEGTILKPSIEHLVKLINERGTRIRELNDENKKLKEQLQIEQDKR